MTRLGKGLPFVLLLLFFLLVFGGMLPRLNQTFFASGGDGIKAYYCAWYHAQYDESSSHFMGMNYPWGDSYSLTDGQPPVANAVRWVHRHLFPVALYIPGIFNFLMLASLMLSACVLFLILRRLGLPDGYGLLVATGMVFLSPQLARLSGHFSLAWGFWIPLLIYLTLLIMEKQRWLTSVLFGVVTVSASLMHIYFFPFAAALLGSYWLHRVFARTDRRNGLIDLAHVSIQIIIPSVLLGLLAVDHLTDRSLHPWGFHVYRAFPATVFLPLRTGYAPFLANWGAGGSYDWESYAYVGLVASAGIWLVLAVWCRQFFVKEGSALRLPGREFGVLLGAAGFLLLVSFGLPFIGGLEQTRDSIGVLRQFRAVARFSWLFYYVANIAVWVLVYRWSCRLRNRTFARSLVALLLAVFSLEAFVQARATFGALDNRVEALSDIANRTEENSWVRTIRPSDYQAIMPLPYFHVGSESCWIDPRQGIDKHMFIASLKTGLPCNGVMLGRTSLSQTYKNIALSRTPWTHFNVLDELPNDKPLLLVVANDGALSRDERRLVDQATLIASTPHVAFRSLSVGTLKALPASVQFPARYATMLDSAKQRVADSTAYVDQNGGRSDERRQVSVKATADFQRLLEAPISVDVTQPLYVRFWVRDFAKDMVMRSELLIRQSSLRQETVEETCSDLFKHIKSFDRQWALIEIQLQPRQEHQVVTLLLRNETLAGQPLYFDEFSVSQIGFE